MGFSCKQAGALLATALCAWRADADPITFDFSGFGTAGFAWADTNKAEFVRGSETSGIDRTGSANLDSLLGVQGTAHFSSSISATAQVMLRRNNSASYGLDVPLAFLKDSLTDDFAVRVGRVPLPFFMISDFRYVGYAYTFIRPPQEVYGQAPLDSVDGADALYSHSFGPIEINAQAYYGSTSFTLPAADVSLKRIAGGSLSATWGPLTLRYGRMTNRTTITSGADQVVAAVAAAGFTDYANALNAHDRAGAFTGYGVSFDWHNILVQGEATEARTGGYPASSRGRYALVGYRISKFTPYATYSVRKVISPQSETGFPAVGPLLPLAEAVDAIIAAHGQHDAAFGVRWDFRESMDLKLQVDHISPQGPGLFVNVQPGFSGPVNVAALAVDFVF